MEIFASGCYMERSVLPAAECDYLLAALAAAPNHGGWAGTRQMLSNQAVRDLANDGRLLQLAQAALSRPAVPFRATMFAKSAAANWLMRWHQDTALPLASSLNNPEWTACSQKTGILYAHAPAWALSRVVALRIHLDASTSDNGPLRVAPGSHRAGVLTHKSAGRSIGPGVKPRARAPSP